MYKGKFDQKSKNTSTDIHEVVSQRNSASTKEKSPAEKNAVRKAAPAAEAPTKRESPVKKEASVKPDAPVKKEPSAKPSSAKEQPARKPAPQAEPPKKKRKGPRLGGVIFYTLYFLFILVFFVATFVALTYLRSWLEDFEAAQPDLKAKQVFQQIFGDPEWDKLYDAAGVADSAYEGKEEFVVYMESRVGDAELTYLETSAGLSGDKKYIVSLNDEKVATFTLTDKNAVSGDSLEDIAAIPNWQLGAVELFFDRENSYRIRKLDGHTAYVNGVALDDSFTVQIATSKVEEYLPEGATGASICTQEVTGLLTMPTVTITDKDGVSMEVTYDETNRTFSESTVTTTMTTEQKDTALNAARTSCLWMIKEVTDRSTVAKYFDPTYDAYKDIINFKRDELIVQDYNTYEFANESVTSFCSYSDDLFSVRVSLDLNIIRTNGTTKNYPYNQSLVLQKNDKGSWLVVAATNVDVSEPVGKVRLTFMNGDEQLYTNFFQTDADEVITPVIPVPEGQVFSGWVRRDVAEDGSTTLTIVFQPDAETGKVAIPEGTTLEPMTLYAFFQDEGAVTEPEIVTVDPEETTPEETAAETTAAETTEVETEAPETTEGG